MATWNHPKRAVVYLALGGGALCVWIFAPYKSKFSVIPLVFGFGGLALFLKGIFLLRKTSDGFEVSPQGLGLTRQATAQLSVTSTHKSFPTILTLVVQVIQDFGAANVLVGPLLHVANDISDSSNNLPSFPVFVTGNDVPTRLGYPTLLFGVN